MRNRTYGGVRGRKTKVGEKLLRFPPTRFMIKTCFLRIDNLLGLLVFEDQSVCICMIDGDWLLSTNLFCKNLLTQVV